MDLSWQTWERSPSVLILRGLWLLQILQYDYTLAAAAAETGETESLVVGDLKL